MARRRWDGNWWFRDEKVGTNDDEDFYGHGGDDLIASAGGNDYVDGGDGHDEVSAGSGSDTVDGGDGEDTIFGGSGHDDLNGGDDDDEISGGSNNDTLLGGFGNDTLDGGDHRDLLLGGAGLDDLFGGEGDDTLDGGNGNDDMSGGNGNDIFRDFDGNNTISGGQGIDTLDYSSFYGRVVVNLSNNAVDKYEKFVERAPTTAVERYEDAGTDSVTLVENVIGSSEDDTIWGNSVQNVLDGGDGNDEIRGGGGLDTVTGGEGADRFVFDDGDAPLAFTGLDGIRHSDLITDFGNGADRIDLSRIDANPTQKGDQAFSLVEEFSGRTGQLRAIQIDDLEWRILGDTNGDRVPDLMIDVQLEHAPPDWVEDSRTFLGWAVSDF